MPNIDSAYFKKYRNLLWFNQTTAKSFFGAKDIKPTVDYNYIDLLNGRIIDIVKKINPILSDSVKIENINKFCGDNILSVYQKLKDNDIIPRLNNQGRRIEEVYFSWMRGYVICLFFKKAMFEIFGVEESDIQLVWDDDLVNIDNFKRTPKADLQIALEDGSSIRIEVQSWFQWTNDIKQHKVLEAKRVKLEDGMSSMVMHFDLFNGQVAFVQLDTIEDDNVNRITRQQMEWQTVFNIDQNYFHWKLTENPPTLSEILED